MTTTKTNPREALERELDGLVHDGVIADYKAINPTGNKLTWTIDVPDGAEGLAGAETKEVRAFLAGLAYGRTLKPAKRERVRKPNPIRDAIARDGRVEVDLTGDQAKDKILRNTVFQFAYQLGHKGAFTVKTENGKLVGEVVR